MPKLTKTVVEKVEPGANDIILRDLELKGFICKITPKGKRVYMVYYRTHGGRERKPVIGVHGVITCEQARETAKVWLAEVSKGGDPALNKENKKANPTVEELAERYLKEYASIMKKASSYLNDKINCKNNIAPHQLAKLKVCDVSRQDIIELHYSLKEKPIMANRCLALLSKMFSLAETWGYRPENTNPCKGVKKNAEQKRERFLSLQEISNLSHALSEAENEGIEMKSAINAIRLLLFTGCRLNEVLSLKWEYVDFENHCLRLPDSKTGAKTVYISPPVLLILERIERINGNPFVIAGKRDGARLINLRKPWVRISARAKLKQVRLHDLRHSYASIAAASGLSLPIIGALLGHTQASTTQRYAHLVGDPLKQASSVIGDKIAAAMNISQKQAEIIPINAGKKR